MGFNNVKPDKTPSPNRVHVWIKLEVLIWSLIQISHSIYQHVPWVLTKIPNEICHQSPALAYAYTHILCTCILYVTQNSYINFCGNSHPCPTTTLSTCSALLLKCLASAFCSVAFYFMVSSRVVEHLSLNSGHLNQHYSLMPPDVQSHLLLQQFQSLLLEEYCMLKW